MIVGGYTLDLYCDLPGNHKYGDWGTCSAPAQYAEQSGSRCRQQARRDGWRLNLRMGIAVCPECSANGWTLLDAIEARDEPD